MPSSIGRCEKARRVSSGSRDGLKDSRVRGYVLDLGPEFFLFAPISDRMWLDGFECFRIRDILDVKRIRMVNLQKLLSKSAGNADPPSLLRSSRASSLFCCQLGKLFLLLAIHHEPVDLDVCRIGRGLGVIRGRVRCWRSTPTPLGIPW
jgi:hypothetical protein